MMKIIQALTLLALCAPTFAAEQPYKKAYTPKQIKLLEDIKKRWSCRAESRQWSSLKNGMLHGLHPDDITAHHPSYLFRLFTDCPKGDPHEKTLRKVMLLLESKANPHCFNRNGPSALAEAPTYAIAKCLVDHSANPTTAVRKTSSNNTGTILHQLINDTHPLRHYITNRTSADIVRMIALHCKAGVNPAETNSDFLSPLALLIKQSPAGDSADLHRLAVTLVKVGTPIDARLIKQPLITPLVRTIYNGIETAQKEIAAIEQTLRATRYPMLITTLQDLQFLSKDTAGIVAEYDFNPHDFFIEQILKEADDALQAARAERAKQATEAMLKKQQECAIL